MTFAINYLEHTNQGGHCMVTVVGGLCEGRQLFFAAGCDYLVAYNELPFTEDCDDEWFRDHTVFTESFEDARFAAEQLGVAYDYLYSYDGYERICNAVTQLHFSFEELLCDGGVLINNL